MKRLIFLFLFIPVGLLQAQWNLEITSQVEQDGKGLGGATISLLQGTKVVKEITSESNGDFTIEVPPNGDFIIQVSYPECNTKKFQVSTRGVPEDIAADNFAPSYKIGGFTMKKPLYSIDYSALKSPMVRIVFFKEQGKFDHEPLHTEVMLTALGKIRDAEQALIERQQAAVKAGDQALKKNDCVLAKTNYENAIKLIPQLPYEEYPKAQLAKCDACIKEKENEGKKAAEEAAAKKAEEQKKLAEAESKKQKEAEEKKLAESKKQEEEAAARKAAEEKKLAEAAAKKAEEEKKVAEAESKKQKDAEEKKLAESKKQEAEAAAKKAEEDKRLAEAENKKLKEAEEKKLAESRKQEAEAAAKKEAEEKKLADGRKQEAEAAKKAEEEKKLAEAESRKQKEAEEKKLAEGRKQEAEAAAKKEAEEKKLAEGRKQEAEAAAKKEAEDKKLAEANKRSAEEKEKKEKAKAKEVADHLSLKEKPKEKKKEEKPVEEKPVYVESSKTVAPKSTAISPVQSGDDDNDKGRDIGSGKAKYSIPQVLGQDRYKTVIVRADDYFKMKRYEEAKAAYEEALSIRAKDPHATKRLALIAQFSQPKQD